VPRTKYPGEANGFFPRVDGIYRKHFGLPLDWQGDHVYIKFEGVYRVAYVYVNGDLVLQYGGSSDGGSAAAYTDFEVRLENITSVTYGPKTPNLIAIYVDGSYGHEHWYAGAGIYRSVHLVRTKKVHIDAGSLYFVATPDTSKISSRSSSISSSSSSSAESVVVSELSAPTIIHSTVAVVNDGAGEASVSVTVRVLDSNDVVVASTTSTAVGVAPHGGTAVVIPPVRRIDNASLWTVQTPHLYNVVCSISDTQTGQVLDSVNTTIGVRSATWKVDTGFYLNGENVKIRGFCNHDDFTAVGMALPDRIWLLRAMQQRGVGANAWRTSHNNYRASVYDIADATGTLVYDENRDLRASALGAMAKMLKAHRNHPSIVAYSLCNEGECNWGKNATGTTSGTSFFSSSVDHIFKY
jgi:beta-galactosidase/beta-glucuronidase